MAYAANGACLGAAVSLPSEADILRCLGRMQCWVRLAEEVIQAEFPDYGIFCAFGIFNVIAGDARTKQTQGAQQQQQLDRLAKVCDVDGSALAAEFGRHQPIARRIAGMSNCNSRAAWQKAIKRTQKHPSTRGSYPVSALKPVLLRYLAWTCSTSKVEQGFSKADRLGCGGNSPASAESESGTLMLMHSSPQDKEVICKRAQKLYAKSAGMQRERPSARVDAGVRRKPKATGEAAWLRKRRQGVAAAVLSGTCPAAQAVVGNSSQQQDAAQLEQWGGAHEKEYQFQMKKQSRNKVDAFLDNLLLDTEVTKGLQEHVKEEQRKWHAADQMMLAKRRRITRMLGTINKKLDWCPFGGCLAVDATMCQDARSAMEARSLVPSTDRQKADVFVVDSDVNKLGERSTWYAALRGCMVVNRRALVSNGESGVFLKYKAAIEMRRGVWLSDSFRQRHPEISAIIEHAISLPQSRWRMLGSDGEALRQLKVNGTNVAYLTVGEACQGSPSDRRRKYTKASFLQLCAKVDLDKSGQC